MSTTEAAEAHAVNALAPFVLMSRLRPALAAPDGTPFSFVVNVTSREGQVRDECEIAVPKRGRGEGGMSHWPPTTQPTTSTSNLSPLLVAPSKTRCSTHVSS